MDRRTVAKIMDDPELTSGERSLFKWQYVGLGDFYTHLWNAIAHADENNLSRLEQGFPSEIRAFRDWSYAPTLKRKFERLDEKWLIALGITERRNAQFDENKL